ncbi:MAG: hypothetical protein HY735_06975, partial [Verrucomicrobia bacterium]|nr:hypothetical protein [Verrucomicrobiota bacterium]
GGPFIGFEGNDFFAGAGLNKFAGNIDPKSLTFNPVELTGKKNAKLTIALAATYLDFETSDFLDVLIDPDGDGPAQFTSLISFAASNDQDKFLNDSSTRQDSPTQLGLRFQDVTYNLPPDATKLVIRFEALNNWWNEIVAFDNIRITAGEAVVKPMVAIRRDAAQIAVDFVGVLQAAASVAGPWTDLPNAISPFAIDSSLGVQFFRARAP